MNFPDKYSTTIFDDCHAKINYIFDENPVFENFDEMSVVNVDTTDQVCSIFEASISFRES